jgi:DNA polymerase-1
LRVVIDIEANGLTNPDKIWVIVCKDIDTGELYIFRNLTDDQLERQRFDTFRRSVTHWIGHNLLSYDYPVLLAHLLVSREDIVGHCTDTFILSKLIDYPRPGGHSVESYGEEFNLLKGFTVEDGSVLESKYFPASFFLQYSKDLENYCIRDVEITHKIYTKYSKYISNILHSSSINLEHHFQLVCNNLSNNGFSFNVTKAKILLEQVTKELSILDKDILSAFPPRLKLIREITPKETKYGTISLTSIPKSMREDVHLLSVGSPFSYCSWSVFNPASHSQIIRVLNQAGWQPVDKTQTHIDTEREIARLKYRKKDKELDTTYKELYSKLQLLKVTGWKINENNLETLPSSAPLPTRLLAKRILLESRRRTLTEWLGLCQPDNRIHGKFYGIGAWTHRMAHQAPNTANIPNEFDIAGKKKLLGKELRSLWCAPKNRLLVGVDAEGIQLRIFAHYINDPEFTKALVHGKKIDKTDPHSLNQRILGGVCKSRQAAKRYIYALLLGAGAGKLREILDCDEGSATEAYDRLLKRYTGFAHLKSTIIPSDAKRGWFHGLDGRRVRIPGDTVGSRRHLAMSGYLQNGEVIVMKSATLKWWQRLEDYDAKLVNLVHDEWQVECPNNMAIALSIAEMMSNSLKEVGEDLKLLCPLAGSYWNDDLKDYTIATNWSKTH